VARLAWSTLLALGLVLSGATPCLHGQGVENLRDCPLPPGENPVTCPKCARARAAQDEDAECREAKAQILRHSQAYSAKEVAEMSCTRAKTVAAIYGWKSYEERQREAKREAEEAARQARREAEKAASKAKEEADRQAARQLDQQTDAVRQQGMGFNPYTATGDPALLREQAKQARDLAKQLRDQSWEALSAGNSQQQWALNRRAQEWDNVANKLETASRNVEYRRQSEGFQARLQRQANQAAQIGLEDAASGVAEEYGTLLRDSLEEALDVPAVPGRYTGERVREYLESATDRAGTVVPLADTAADYIAGPMRREINRHLDSSRNLPPSRGGGGYSGPSSPSSSRAWSQPSRSTSRRASSPRRTTWPSSCASPMPPPSCASQRWATRPSRR